MVLFVCCQGRRLERLPGGPALPLTTLFRTYGALEFWQPAPAAGMGQQAGLIMAQLPTPGSAAPPARQAAQAHFHIVLN